MYSQLFTKLDKAVGKYYGVETIAKEFSVSLPMATHMMKEIQKSSQFLSMISMIGTREKSGQIVTVNAPANVMRNVDLSSSNRVTTALGSTDGRTYSLHTHYSDAHVTYETIEDWADDPKFNAMVMALFREAMALSFIKVGFHGTSCATTSNFATNTLLQDVNKGWIQKLKEGKAANFLDDDITLGTYGDYKNLDQLVAEIKHMIPIEHRTGKEIVLVGEDLVAWNTNKILEAYGKDPQREHDVKMLEMSYAGLRACTPSFFPAKGIMVADPKQLQIYYQKSSIRKHIKDVPEKDRFEHYNRGNYAWEIGDLDAVIYLDSTKVTLSDVDPNATDDSTDNDNQNV